MRKLENPLDIRSSLLFSSENFDSEALLEIILITSQDLIYVNMPALWMTMNLKKTKLNKNSANFLKEKIDMYIHVTG